VSEKESENSGMGKEVGNCSDGEEEVHGKSCITVKVGFLS
jgi:hypothetical protein